MKEVDIVIIHHKDLLGCYENGEYQYFGYRFEFLNALENFEGKAIKSIKHCVLTEKGATLFDGNKEWFLDKLEDYGEDAFEY